MLDGSGESGMKIALQVIDLAPGDPGFEALTISTSWLDIITASHIVCVPYYTSRLAHGEDVMYSKH